MVGIAISFGVALAWCAAAVRLGPRIGFIDLPDDPRLKVHGTPAVPLAGPGIFLAVHAAMAVAGTFDAGLALASGLVLVLGLVDDRIGLGPPVRLLAEGVAGVALVLAAATPLAGGPLELALGAALVVLCVNAVNLFDGLDGLAGSAGLVAALGLAWLASQRGLDASFGAILAAALAGFLLLNWHPARIFLGDAGAYVLGLFLAYGFLQVTPEGIGTRLAVAVGLLGVFALDLVVTVLRRRLNGRPLFAGDRSHLYDQLRDRGASVVRVAVSAALLQGCFVVGVVAADHFLGGPAAVVALGVGSLGLVVGLASGGFLHVDPGSA